jgi:hypothetical protein
MPPTISPAPPEYGEGYLKKLEELEGRAEAAELKINRWEITGEPPSLWIMLGDEEDAHRIRVSDTPSASDVLGVDFEAYRSVPGFDAIFRADRDEIEAYLRPSIGREVEDRGPFPCPVQLSSSAGAELELDAPSRDHKALRYPGRRAFGMGVWESGDILRLKGFGASDPTRAMEIVEKVGTNFLFELDLLYDISTDLARGDRRDPFDERDWPISAAPPAFPSNGYDMDPVRLYMYGRLARDMPLLEYLSYYQAIEFYFPHYAAADLRLRVEKLVKDPRFNPHGDRDIAQLLEVLESGSGRARETEVEQLKATLRSCIEVGEISDFLEHGEERAAALADRRSPVTPHTIAAADRNTDLRDAAARRIYDIRCRIVHAKDDVTSTERRGLLPHSPEVHLLKHDLALLRLLAARVLVASSGEFRP